MISMSGRSLVDTRREDQLARECEQPPDHHPDWHYHCNRRRGEPPPVLSMHYKVAAKAWENAAGEKPSQDHATRERGQAPPPPARPAKQALACTTRKSSFRCAARRRGAFAPATPVR